MILATVVAASAVSFKILFLGNSHTSTYDVPSQVRNLLQAGMSGASVVTETRYGGLLNDIANDPAIFRQIQNNRYTHIVLQGAAISSSHQYEYSQAGGIRLAKAAVASRATTFFFAEWSRRNWQETEYILNVYRKIQKAAPGSKIIPVGKAFDIALNSNPNIDLWASDGNHSNPSGAYLASCVIAHWIAPEGFALQWEPAGLPNGPALRKAANALANR